MVRRAIRDFRDANPDKSEATSEDIIATIDPIAAELARTDQVAAIQWSLTLDNIIKELGRDGEVEVHISRDQRGYESPVISF
jgi:hypothetical protein